MTIKTDVVIIGAGPSGLFQVFELGLLDIHAHVIDSLGQVGGQCSELYPDKPIYDIPALPVCGAQELIDRLMEQIKPFDPVFHLGQTVNVLEPKDDGRFLLETSSGERFDTATVILAAGLGAFQPRRLRAPGAENWEGERIQTAAVLGVGAEAGYAWRFGGLLLELGAGGYISGEVGSAEGGGSCFRIRLPIRQNSSR